MNGRAKRSPSMSRAASARVGSSRRPAQIHRTTAAYLVPLAPALPYSRSCNSSAEFRLGVTGPLNYLEKRAATGMSDDSPRSDETDHVKARDSAARSHSNLLVSINTIQFDLQDDPVHVEPFRHMLRIPSDECEQLIQSE